MLVFGSSTRRTGKPHRAPCTSSRCAEPGLTATLRRAVKRRRESRSLHGKRCGAVRSGSRRRTPRTPHDRRSNLTSVKPVLHPPEDPKARFVTGTCRGRRFPCVVMRAILPRCDVWVYVARSRGLIAVKDGDRGRRVHPLRVRRPILTHAKTSTHGRSFPGCAPAFPLFTVVKIISLAREAPTAPARRSYFTGRLHPRRLPEAIVSAVVGRVSSYAAPLRALSAASAS